MSRFLIPQLLLIALSVTACNTGYDERPDRSKPTESSSQQSASENTSEEKQKTTSKSHSNDPNGTLKFFMNTWFKENFCETESALYHMQNGPFESKFAKTPREECEIIAGLFDSFDCVNDGLRLTIGDRHRIIPVNWQSKADVDSKIRAISEFKTAICVEGVWLIYKN